jgi:RIO kinase 1
MDKYEAYDKYGDYEDFTLPRWESNRHRKLNHRKEAKKKPAVDRADLSDFSDDVSEWVPSYAAALDPLHYERQWLIDSLGPFYRNQLITDVVRRVKGGKEANVYCCIAHPTAGVDLIAAKLYRPRSLRMLKNDAVYKAGRQLRDEEGKQLKGRRERLALAQKTRFGKHLDTMWWIGNEFSAQQKLFDAGADVPQPSGHSGNAILMEYIGNEQLPAPALSDISLEKSEAGELFQIIIDNIQLMLDNHLVHGDLSPYNILFWNSDVKIIDFPQIVEARHNPNAYQLLIRDIKRVCTYFARYQIRSDPEQMSRDFWQPYMGRFD